MKWGWDFSNDIRSKSGATLGMGQGPTVLVPTLVWPDEESHSLCFLQMADRYCNFATITNIMMLKKLGYISSRKMRIVQNRLQNV